LVSTPWRGAVCGALLGFFLNLGLMIGPSPQSGDAIRTAELKSGRPGQKENMPPVATKTVEAPVHPLHVEGEDEFKSKILRADGPCLVDFYSDHCAPCRMLAPTIERLAAQYAGRACVCKIDVGNRVNLQLAERYAIRSIPAVLFFDHGGETCRYVGLREEADYIAVLDEMLASRRVAPKDVPQVPAPPEQ